MVAVPFLIAYGAAAVAAWSPAPRPRLPAVARGATSFRNPPSPAPLPDPTGGVGAEGEAPLCEALETELGGGDLLREVDESSALWRSLDELPVVANPLLAAVRRPPPKKTKPKNLTPLSCRWSRSGRRRRTRTR